MQIMSKVALMTWYKYFNYGTSLQVFALSNKIKEFGYDCEVINYKPKGKTSDIVSLCDIIELSKKSILNNYSYSSDTRNNLFEKFLSSNLVETKKCNSFPELESLNDTFNAFVCGSDQIWSPLCFDTHYYLDFAVDSKIISYAPSIGSNEIKDDVIKKEISKLVKRFNFLSVREEKGKEIIKQISGKDAKVVLDPTFLHSSTFWKKLENNECIKSINENYAVCYFLGDSKKHLRRIEDFCKKNKLVLYNIPTFTNVSINKYNFPFEVGPSEFLSLIDNASMIFTDSFHGINLSVIFNKPFYTFKRFKDKSKECQNSRIYNILEKLGLENRLLNDKVKIKDQPIDYKAVNLRLTSLVTDSVDYLKESLKCVCSNSITDTLQSKCVDTDLCCGCGACSAVCPTKAIDIVENQEGFYCYKINKEKCINCGKCKNVCSMYKPKSVDISDALALYSFKATNQETLNNSSSGGFSHTLATLYIKKGYKIVGCTYDNEKHIAKHIIIDNIEDLSKIQGSKYIQSNTKEAFDYIYNNSNDKYLFFGTPCQVAGLRKLMGDINNIIYVDLICHGVPTMKLWRKYLNEVVKKYRLNNNLFVTIRKKNNTWRKMSIEICDDKKVYINNEMKDLFYLWFKSQYCYNHSCYECPYREYSSADIRIGDYWGNKFDNDNTGVSMVIAMNKIGQSIIDEINNNNLAMIDKQDLDDYWSIQYPYNPQKPVFYDEINNEFVNDRVQLKELTKKYLKCSIIIEKIRRGKKYLRRR